MKKIFALLILSVFVISAAMAVTIDAADIAKGEITSVTTVNGGTINATSDKNVTVEDRPETKKAPDGLAFNARIKLNGSGDASKRSITFSAAAGEKIDIYLNSSSGSDARTLILADSTGATVQSITAPADTGTVGKVTFTAAADDNYTVWSKSGGINIYRIATQQ